MLPTVILPGYFESADVYLPLQQALTEMGTPTTTVPLRIRDWLPTLSSQSMVPILRELNRTVNAALIDNNSQQINLIDHSAGGWISRIYMGEVPYTIYGDVTANAVGLWNARSKIATLITLGTPQISCQKWTKKNLNFANDNYPGAFYPEVQRFKGWWGTVIFISPIQKGSGIQSVPHVPANRCKICLCCR